MTRGPDSFYAFPNYPRTWRPDEDREDVESEEGTITFNWLQQHKEGFDPPAPPTPVEEAGTTDPNDITDGAFGE